MKKNIIYALTAFILCVFAVQDVKAQRFIGSVAAGVNFAQIEGDGVHGFTKVGFNGGAGLTVPLNPKQTWQLHVELLYAAPTKSASPATSTRITTLRRCTPTWTVRCRGTPP